MSAATSSPAREWLTVHEASALIGVSPATLRRWTDAGDVLAFTTPGGHRRYARSTILAMLPPGPRPRPSLQRLGETTEHMTRVYRRHMSRTCRGVHWLGDLGEEELVHSREYGRVIAGSLLAHIDAAEPAESKAALAKAVTAADEYGRIAAACGAGVASAVETFQRFRSLFLGQLVEVARRRGLDTTEATDLLTAADKAFDQLMMALLRGYERRAALREAT